MLFAVGAGDALTILEAQTIDVVVTDMRMPGMDGAALLDRVRILQPEAARIVLSGFSEREAIFRTVGPAHQYYVKPCQPQILVEAIRRALSVRRTLRSPALLALVSGATSIPAMPSAMSALFSELQSPNGSASEAARIIATDVGLTVSLLKLTNSGFFYIPSAITDVLQAVKMLGFEMVRALAVMAGIFEAFRCGGVDCDLLRQLERRSLQIGAVARKIAQSNGLGQAALDQTQCAGMLAHVGSLLLFSNWPGVMEELRRGLDRSGGGIIAAERAALGASHAELGGVLLGLWGFTDPVVEAVLYHHEPSRCEYHSSAEKSPLVAVHAAQHLIKPIPPGKNPMSAWAEGLDMAFLERIGCASRIKEWAGIAEASREEDT
ncbi:Hydrogenase transcriptional regulatory protein HoxA [Paramagnetospirillum magnetotacticum MS-1]|uniref:Hydrogenase transcriptional regulatory protein HoxA n=1 Tax=Paramagnetospirillum magnetotacticum MS-1 TaxID=272627 RepID=A0A0C2YR22_PARME|nr:HDOD domain-containing protein [Paramagnetospirillum magnetotacticum]KIL97130.1 Hydrogenase transcriptional regulatory protein HoxA [Paramagnetospirillum magnetotacticum MS-1]